MEQLNIPYFKPSIDNSEIEAVKNCLKSGWLTQGGVTKGFEDDFTDFLGSKNIYTLAVNSATSGLHLALESLGIGPGDEVIVPSLTFTATAEVVSYVGAKPIFVDIDLQTLCINFDEIIKKITDKTKAIIPVHFGGFPLDTYKLRSILNERSIAIINDAAHALPSSLNGILIGSEESADITVFSFYANKTITTGEGGMISTRNVDLFNRMSLMRLHGMNKNAYKIKNDKIYNPDYDVIEAGFKYNITDIASSIGRVQLKKLRGFAKKRNIIAERYYCKLNHRSVILPPNVNSKSNHAWHLFPIQIVEDENINAKKIMNALSDNKVGYSIHYRPLTMTTFWKKFIGNEKFPNCDLYFSRCISLPIYPSLQLQDVDRISELIIKEIES